MTSTLKHFDKQQVLREFFELKKKRNLESSTTSLHSISKDPKYETLSKTVKRVKQPTNEMRERITFNSPIQDNDTYNKQRLISPTSKNKDKMRKMNIYDIYKVTCSNMSNKLYDNTIPRKKKINQYNTIPSKSPMKNKLIKSSQTNDKAKLISSLQDKIAFLEIKIAEYKIEKNDLRQQLNEIANDENAKKIEKLENEIKNYQNTSNVYLKTCSQLAEEIIILRRELEKYMVNTVKHSKSFEKPK